MRLLLSQQSYLCAQAVQSIRQNKRFPLRFPSETKRHRKSSWDTRISTPGGKNMIMKRILKRKQVLCSF